MTTTINFFSSEFDGMTAELHSPTMPLLPIAVTTISGGAATFNNVLPLFAVRIRDGGDTVLRTGVQTQAVGETDNNGNFSASFLVMRITDTDDTNIPLSDLESNISLPMVEDEVSVNTLTLATVGSDVRASGSGSYDAGIFGDIPFTYTYDFDLDPVTSALSSRVISVESMNTSVTGSQGGLLGWLVNLLVNFMTWVFSAKIEEQIETIVQDRVDQAVADAFQDAPDGSMATLLSVNETGGQVVIEPVVSIPLANLDCVSLITNGSVKVRPLAQLRRLRLMRDKVLRNSPQGRAYIELFKRHSPELIHLLTRRPKLLKRVDRLIERGLKEFSDENPQEGKLSAETAQLAIRVMQALAREGSPQLRRTLELAIPDVKTFVGRPVRVVLEENQKQLVSARKSIR